MKNNAWFCLSKIKVSCTPNNGYKQNNSEKNNRTVSATGQEINSTQRDKVS
jgi:hypothetical protein